MQQWLNDPKNRPIVFGIAACLLIGGIVLVLFQSGVIGQTQQAYVPPTATTDAATTATPGVASPTPAAPTPAGTPAPAATTPLPTPTATVAAVPPASGLPVPPNAAVAAKLKGHKVRKIKTKVKLLAVVPAAAPAMPVPVVGGAAAPGTPAVVAAAPDARRDPFAPYVDVTKFLQSLNHPVDRPRVDTFAPPLSITTYNPEPTLTASTLSRATAYGQGAANQSGTAAIGRVSGAMLGTGAYAIVDNGGQSLVLQPGDQLPNGAGELMSIQSDSITVKSDGQLIKVPISSGDAGGAGTGGPAYGGGPPPGMGIPGRGPTGPPPGYNIPPAGYR